MAGIGFELKKIIDKDNIFGTITRSIENIIRKLFDFNRGDYYDKM